jgi:hypothetical protein
MLALPSVSARASARWAFWFQPGPCAGTSQARISADAVRTAHTERLGDRRTPIQEDCPRCAEAERSVRGHARDLPCGWRSGFPYVLPGALVPVTRLRSSLRVARRLGERARLRRAMIGLMPRAPDKTAVLAVVNLGSVKARCGAFSPPIKTRGLASRPGGSTSTAKGGTYCAPPFDRRRGNGEGRVSGGSTG